MSVVFVSCSLSCPLVLAPTVAIFDTEIEHVSQFNLYSGGFLFLRTHLAICFVHHDWRGLT